MKQETSRPGWWHVTEVAELPSPSLLVYPQRVEENLKRMLAIAGAAERLRPHIKTHKMREPIELLKRLGVTKFKCATIAEAELAANTGVADLLLAYQPVGPAARRVAELVRQFRLVRFSVVCDDEAAIRELSAAISSLPHRGSAAARLARASQREIEVLIDLDIGQHRTGVPAGPEAVALYQLVASLPGLKPGGLHAYDGHLSEPDPVQRAHACESAFAPVIALRQQLQAAGLSVPRIVAGGTPTFPFHAKRGDVECSPGTCVFWDAGYASKLRDLDFMPAALVLTRIVSKPGGNRLCLDLGHKAIASEMPHPRVKFLDLDEAQAVMHSEEHLVIETSRSGEFKVGNCLYGVPWHICPTVALHSEAFVVEDGKAVGTWEVAARERRLTV
ncbi:MAG TPA: D-TA family PLP-dependent enzyme [Verrucomicrobiae bacterium]|nr:D-TA family PLP-dependent enzyme [Verrucomicrobiae bacterium]